MSTHKDHYATLGLTSKASQQEIQNAYQKLAAEWHPEKHPGDRVRAQKKFNDISEAYFTLSSPARRDHYDSLMHKYSTEDAYKTFEKFFSEQTMVPEEQEFFDKHYPDRKKTYYEILGVPKNATYQEIQEAYRKQALKHHPKANEKNPEAEKKFVQISEAYNHLSDMTRRKHYDDYRFGDIVPFNSYNIFNDFFNTNPFLAEDDNTFFKPILAKPSSFWKEFDRTFDKDFMDIEKLGPQTEFAESYKSSSFRERGPQGITGKTITEKSSLKDGKKHTVKTQEILKPDGTKEVTETIHEGTEIKTNKYSLVPGQEKKAIGL